MRGVAFWLPRVAPQLRDRLSVDSHMYGRHAGASRRDPYLSFSAVNLSGGIDASGEDFAAFSVAGESFALLSAGGFDGRSGSAFCGAGVDAGFLRSFIQAIIGPKPPKYRGAA